MAEGIKLSSAVGRLVGGVMEEKAEAGINVAMWEVSKLAGIKNMFAHTFASIEDATQDEITGIAPDGITDILERFIDTTVKLATIIDKEIAGELFGEMIQEGVSNAIQTSLGGAMQTIFNLRRGSFPAMQDYANMVGQNIDSGDRIVNATVSAMAGMNAITTAFDLSRGANQQIQNSYRFLGNEIENVTTYINTQSLGIYGNILVAMNVLTSRLIHMPLEVAMVYHEVVRRIAEEHLARLNELEDTLEAIKNYLENGYMDYTTAELEASKVKAEIEATQQSYNTFISSLQTVYDDTINYIATNVGSVYSYVNLEKTQIVDNLIEVLNLINYTLDAEVKSDLVTKLNEIYETILTYREIWQKSINFG